MTIKIRSIRLELAMFFVVAIHLIRVKSSSRSNSLLTLNKCPSGHAHIADNFDCHDFYHCTTVEHAGYAIMVRKSCGTFLMFDPFVQNCNWPFRVRQFRPECNALGIRASKPHLTRIYAWHPRGKNPLKDSKNEFITKVSTNQSPHYPDSQSMGLYKSTTMRMDTTSTAASTTPPTSTQPSTTPSFWPKASTQRNAVLSKVIPMGRFNLKSLRVFTPQNFTKLREAHPKTLLSNRNKAIEGRTPPLHLIKLRILK